MRLFRKLEDGKFEEIKTMGRLASVYDAVEEARKAGGDSEFVADFQNGDVLDFSMKDREPVGLKHENVRTLPDTELPSYHADKEAAAASTNTKVGVYGAFFGDDTKSNSEWDDGNASEEHPSTPDHV